MTTSQECLLHLLGTSLFGAPAPEGLSLDADGWKDVFMLSGRQSVQAVAFDALQDISGKAGLPLDLAGRWMNEVNKVETSYKRMSFVADKQRDTWARHSVEAILLKGLESAKYYPVPQHRVCGDIDWWLPSEKDWNDALEVVKNNGIAVRWDSDGDFNYSLGGVVVEHHRKGLVCDGPIGELVLLNEHILHHAMVSGVGLRHICDYALALDYWQGKYDAVEYDNILKDRGLRRWAGLLDRIVDFVRNGSDKPSGDVARFMDLVWMDGNFGFGKKRRFGGFIKRAALFCRYCPVRFVRRWNGLVMGKLRFISIFAS